MALARARKVDAILVTELSRWGRSTQDLVQTLNDLHGWKVIVLAQTGLSFDRSTASGKLMRTIMAGLAEFERDLIRERVKSGLAAAQARGVKLGRSLDSVPPTRRPDYRSAAPSPTTTNGAQNAGCASWVSPLSMSAIIERRKASARPTFGSRAISRMAAVISLTVASE
jgi:DNA invertase Pin-like site-specific DNA recombinase